METQSSSDGKQEQRTISEILSEKMGKTKGEVNEILQNLCDVLITHPDAMERFTDHLTKKSAELYRQRLLGE